MTYIERPTWKGGTEIVLVQTEALNNQALFTCELMRHLSISAAMPDGEDSTGRQKFRLMTEEEVVQRASQIAALAWDEYRKRGWTLNVPVPKPSAGDEWFRSPPENKLSADK